ncbi:MAG: glycosyltransferase family 2 protein [Bacillota bacterium]
MDLTTIILTYNEELNIKDCIKSVQNISKRIIVIDSFSTDRTVEIANLMGAEVYQNEFINQAKQFMYAMEKTNIKSQWVLRLDADERLTSKSSAELKMLCEKNKDTDVTGIILRFEVTFLGRKLKHGGIYPCKILRVFKNGFCYMEDRSMDERFVLTEGRAVEMKSDSLHCDYKNLNFWINKHNIYSTREVEDYLKSLTGEKHINQLDSSGRFKRFVKFNIYYKLPMGYRAFIYFIYRYFIKLGFLDGKEGLIFAVLQSFWYRFLVDAKIFEKKLNQKMSSGFNEEHGK